MTLTEQIYAQALLLTRDLEKPELPMLEVLCRAAEAGLTAKLRDGITAQDCKADFVAAASLYALAASTEMELAGVSRLSEEDPTQRRKSADAASCCLRYQAQLLMAPYLKDEFVLLGV